MDIQKAESEEHRRLVQALANYVKAKGFEVTCGSSLGLPECHETGGYIPDLKAHSSVQSVVLFGEVETADTIDSDHTRRQIKAFSGRRMEGGKGKLYPFCIMVPKGYSGLMRRVVQSIRLTDDERESVQVVEA